MVTAQILEWNRDEKVSFIAERLMKLPERRCYLQLPGQEGFEYEVEWVDRPDLLVQEK
jgi:hypothetical protein